MDETLFLIKILKMLINKERNILEIEKMTVYINKYMEKYDWIDWSFLYDLRGKSENEIEKWVEEVMKSVYIL